MNLLVRDRSGQTESSGTAESIGGLRQQSKHDMSSLNSNHSRCLGPALDVEMKAENTCFDIRSDVQRLKRRFSASESTTHTFRSFSLL